ncbi:hypothetical protein D3C71_2152230 [compost metagenome]
MSRHPNKWEDPRRHLPFIEESKLTRSTHFQYDQRNHSDNDYHSYTLERANDAHRDERRFFPS